MIADTRATHEDGVTIEKGARLLNTYTIMSSAIQGGMGKVWRVHHEGWNVDLAMKQPKAELFKHEHQKETFMAECEAWIALGLHPHIVSCHYIREIQGIPSIFSQWMQGGSLSSWIGSGKLYQDTQMSALERIIDISIQFARGLHYAHEAGLIHQDVKPDNLLLTLDGVAKVADFGIARARVGLANEDAAVAEGGTMMAPSGGYTPAYCSPEQSSGEVLTRRTDIYSWAVSVLEMSLGERLWTSGVVAGMACDDYFALEARVPLPTAMKALLLWCLQADPQLRPRDFKVVDAALLALYKEAFHKDYAREAPLAASATADSLNNRALSYLDMDKPDLAQACWQEALELLPQHDHSLYNQSLYLWRNARITDAAALTAVKNGSGPRQNVHLAMLHLERCAPAQALEALVSLPEQEDEAAALRQRAHDMLAQGETISLVHTLPFGQRRTKGGARQVSGFLCGARKKTQG